MFPKPQFDPDKNTSESQQEEKLPKLRLEELPSETQREKEKWERIKADEMRDAALSAQTATIRTAEDIHTIKGWVTFIGILIIIGEIAQLLGSCV
ncbi:MAG: hypothetical protein WBI14_02625 [Anaerolineaceae bacterium]